MDDKTVATVTNLLTPKFLIYHDVRLELHRTSLFKAIVTVLGGLP